MGKIHDRIKAQQQRAVRIQPHKVVWVDKPDGTTEKVIKVKGYYNGLCNVTHCQTPHRVEWYNKYTNAFYCPDCAFDINSCNAHFKDCDNGEPFINFVTAEEAKLKYVNP